MTKIIGFLRGINVGGHHKVPMADLQIKLMELGCENVKTLLNSGNFVFSINEMNFQELEDKIEKHLFNAFGFPIPVILKYQSEITDLINMNPFEKIIIHKDIRLYVTFLKSTPEVELTIPYISKDNAFQIISVQNKIILSVLDLSVTKTTKGMDDLEKLFGKNITTRNWNTIVKISDI